MTKGSPDRVQDKLNRDQTAHNNRVRYTLSLRIETRLEYTYHLSAYTADRGLLQYFYVFKFDFWG